MPVSLKLGTLVDMSISRFFHNLLFRIKHGGKDIFKIEVTNQGVRLLKNNLLINAIVWADIHSIEAFKKDNLTVDPIVLNIRHSANTKHETAFDEFMLGFDILVLEINKRYGLNETWLNRVNTGAFCENLEVLWQRA